MLGNSAMHTVLAIFTYRYIFLNLQITHTAFSNFIKLKVLHQREIMLWAQLMNAINEIDN